MYFDVEKIIETDRIVPFSLLLDEVFYKSSIEDMRANYFKYHFQNTNWILLSDYFFGNEKKSKTITFTALPYILPIDDLQKSIQSIAPKDLKHTRNVNIAFVELLHSLPILNICFVFENSRNYLIWNNQQEFLNDMEVFAQVIDAYRLYWIETEPSRRNRLNGLSKNIAHIRECLQHKRKIKILCEAFCISFLGGYVGSILSRETQLSSLVWMSDRDRSNELGTNLVRDLFQINLVNITKQNINFAFTTANSSSEEWYEELIRIPDYLTGTIANFDFREANHSLEKETVRKMLGGYFLDNRQDTFIFKFIVNDDGVKIRRTLISGKSVR